MTPNDIEVLIHIHVSPRIHPRIDAPAVMDAIDMLLKRKLIERVADTNSYMTTSRGDAHISQLCALPWPQPAWLGADGKVIGDAHD